MLHLTLCRILRSWHILLSCHMHDRFTSLVGPLQITHTWKELAWRISLAPAGELNCCFWNWDIWRLYGGVWMGLIFFWLFFCKMIKSIWNSLDDMLYYRPCNNFHSIFILLTNYIFSNQRKTLYWSIHATITTSLIVQHKVSPLQVLIHLLQISQYPMGSHHPRIQKKQEKLQCSLSLEL